MVNVSCLPLSTPSIDQRVDPSTLCLPSTSAQNTDPRLERATLHCENDIESTLIVIVSLAESFVEKIGALKSYLMEVEKTVGYMHEYNIDSNEPSSKQYVRRVKEGTNVADYTHKCSEIKGILKVVNEIVKHCPMLATKLRHLFSMESNFSSKNSALISKEYHLAAVADLAPLLPDVAALLLLAEKLGKSLQMLEAEFLNLKTETEKMFLSSFCYAPSHPQNRYVQLAEGKSKADLSNYVKNLARIDEYEKIPAKLEKFSTIFDLDNKFIIKHKNPIYNDLINMRTGRPLPDFTYLKEGWSDLG